MKKSSNVIRAAVMVALATGCMLSTAEAGKYQNQRFNDDLSGETSGWQGALKNITSEAEFSMGGQARLRWENWNNFGFGEANDDDFGLTRIRLHGNLELGDQFRVFIEGKSAFSTERDLPGGRRSLDEDSLALQNAFFDVTLPSGDEHEWLVRVGRQELQFGKQRLISPLDWSNTRRTWDGILVNSTCSKWNLSAFATQFVPVDQHDFNEANEDEDFFGIYATHKLEKNNASYDIYWLLRERDNLAGAEEGTTFNEERHTVGTRLGGTCPLTGLNMDLEGGYQFGDLAEQDIKAWFASVKATTPQGKLPGGATVSVGYDIASGDGDAADGDAETFSQLYPLGHAYFGWIDVVGRQNVIDISQEVTFKPMDKVLVKVQNHFFQRADNADALYHAGGAVVRAGDAGGSHDVGQEVDLLVKYTPNANLACLLGYSHFFAGDFIDETAANEDIDFTYVSTQYTF